MINLIPNQEKKKMVRDFYFRLMVLVFVMLSVVSFIAIVSLLPAYVLSMSEKNIASKKLETQKGEPVPLLDTQTSAMIQDLNSKLDLIEKIESNTFTVSQKIINAVLTNKTEGIKINQITYENDTAKGRIVRISGIALSREILLAFRKSLEENPNFQNVDLPISNFVKGSDIQFYLSLVPRSGDNLAKKTL